MRLGLIVALIVAVADQLSKFWLLGFFAGQPPGTRVVPVTGFFNLVLTWNRGMSFGVLNNDGAFNTLLFTVLAAVIVGALLRWLWRTREPFLGAAIGLVVGGAVGNVIDRLTRGAVVDFLDFHLGEGAWSHWFAFNLADAAICVGVGLMVIDSLVGRRTAPD